MQRVGPAYSRIPLTTKSRYFRSCGSRKVLEVLREGKRVVIMAAPEGTGADVSRHATGPREGGRLMSATHGRPVLASYRDTVAEQMSAGETFGEVEDSIDQLAEVTLDEKAALWLFAFSLRNPAEQQLEARAHLASLI
jgi:hypothetical protein